MNRIDQTFADLKIQSKVALIAFVTAGDVQSGDPIKQTVDIMHHLVKGGSNIIELGVPFSDPNADGPTIQKSNERALAHHIGLHDILRMVRIFRQTDTVTPVLLMGYLNPIENFGYAAFVEAMVKAGVDGLITVDLPPEESTEFNKLLDAVEIYPIYLLAPTTSDERIKKICQHSKGFIYYVSVKGVTGQKTPQSTDVATKIKIIKKYTNLPVGVGFGIKDAKSVKAIGEFADAVVIGSAIINAMQTSPNNPAKSAGDFVSQMLS